MTQEEFEQRMRDVYSKMPPHLLKDIRDAHTEYDCAAHKSGEYCCVDLITKEVFPLVKYQAPKA